MYDFPTDAPALPADGSPPRFLLVQADALPEIFLKILETKELLTEGRAKNISEATRATGISRSAYYKYKDAVYPHQSFDSAAVMTFYAILSHRPGVLSAVMSELYNHGGNIVSINQSIPSHGAAPVFITLATDGLACSETELLRRIREVPGVGDARLVSMQ